MATLTVFQGSAVCCCLLVLCVSANTVLHFQPDVSLDQSWSEYKLQFGKKYVSAEEEFVRRELFAANLKKIEVHNYLYSKGLRSYSMAVNQFTDMDTVEVARVATGLKFSAASVSNRKQHSSVYLSPNVPFTLPDSVDWRKQGYVTPVKNQGNCGSCWSFSTTGSVEGQHYRKTKQLVSLSEQNLVDCSWSYGNNGCEGGLMDNAFTYIKDNKGIDTEECYPYTGKADHTCHFNASCIGAVVTGFVDLPAGDELKLMEALATIGPVSVAIDAEQSFINYQQGLYDEPTCSSEQLNHGVLAVGYGTTPEGQDYWIVKNSWGEGWGEKGYIRMARNKSNQCGIATMASYPLV
jgi:cathepsin L